MISTHPIPRREFGRQLALLAGAFALPKLAPASDTPPLPSILTAVDTHAHIFTRGLKFAEPHRYVPDYDATLADYLKQLDGHGISHGVLVQPSFLGTDNSYLLAALKTYPRLLRGVVVVDPATSFMELSNLASAGVVGVRLNLIGAALPDFHQAPWPNFLARLRQLNWLVEVQREARDLPAVVAPLLAEELNIVIDHFGRPDPALGADDPGFRYLLAQASSRQLWIKLSGAYRNGVNGTGEAIAQAAVPLLRRAFGAERLLWGSDWPHTQFEHVANYAAARAQLDHWISDPAERATILRATPAQLYRFSLAT